MDSDPPLPIDQKLASDDVATSGEEWVPPHLLDAGPRPHALVGSESTRTAVEFLSSGSVDELYRALVEDDPIGLAELVREGLDELAVLVDPQRLLDLTAAQCAYAAQDSVPTAGQPLRQWVGAQMMAAFDLINEEDWCEERQGLPTDPFDERYAGLCFGSELSANEARRVALLFNRLKARVRVPLYALLVKGRSMVDVAREFGMTKDELHGLVVRHLSAFTTGPRAIRDDPFAERPR